MPNTPGQLACAVYWQGAPVLWALLSAEEQARWERTAQAVRALVTDAAASGPAWPPTGTPGSRS